MAEGEIKQPAWIREQQTAHPPTEDLALLKEQAKRDEEKPTPGVVAKADHSQWQEEQGDLIRRQDLQNQILEARRTSGATEQQLDSGANTTVAPGEAKPTLLKRMGKYIQNSPLGARFRRRSRLHTEIMDHSNPKNSYKRPQDRGREGRNGNL